MQAYYREEHLLTCPPKTKRDEIEEYRAKSKITIAKMKTMSPEVKATPRNFNLQVGAPLEFTKIEEIILALQSIGYGAPTALRKKLADITSENVVRNWQ